MLELLTDREEEVLQAISEGRTNAQIAKQFTLSPQTVKAHVRSILRKLRMHERASAVRLAIDLDIIEGPKTSFNFGKLEPDELLLCELVSEGKTDDQIRTRLRQTKRFIQKQASEMCDKVGVEGRYHLAGAYTKWKKTHKK